MLNRIIESLPPLNPSDIEFLNHKNDNYSFEHRFPDYDNTLDSLELACKNYFKINPYNKWFGQNNVGFKPFLMEWGIVTILIHKTLKQYSIPIFVHQLQQTQHGVILIKMKKINLK